MKTTPHFLACPARKDANVKCVCNELAAFLSEDEAVERILARRAAAAERAAIVRWLRDPGSRGRLAPTFNKSMGDLADAIERGDHMIDRTRMESSAVHRCFIGGGHLWEVVLDVEGEFRGMVHLIDVEKLHDPLNSDVVMTGARYDFATGRITLGDADVRDGFDPALLPLMEEAIARTLPKAKN